MPLQLQPSGSYLAEPIIHSFLREQARTEICLLQQMNGTDLNCYFETRSDSELLQSATSLVHVCTYTGPLLRLQGVHSLNNNAAAGYQYHQHYDFANINLDHSLFCPDPVTDTAGHSHRVWYYYTTSTVSEAAAELSRH